jgi:hypothetical protein
LEASNFAAATGHAAAVSNRCARFRPRTIRPIASKTKNPMAGF